MKPLEPITIQTENNLHITFCKTCKTCPAVDISKDKDIVVIGGDEEGYTKFTKEQFELFVQEVKKGVFDEYIK